MIAEATGTQNIPNNVLGSGVYGRERPSPPGALSTSLTFAWRSILKLYHVPEQLFDAVGTPVIFVLMFTYLFGNALAGSTKEYLQFVLPGILVYTIISMTVYTG